MMKQEFLDLMQWEDPMLTEEQYQKIEAAYMNTNESKQDFAKRVRTVYDLTVAKAIEKYFHELPMETTLGYLDGNQYQVNKEADNIRFEKTNQMIDLLQ